MLGVLHLGVGGGCEVTNLRAPEEDSAGPPVVSCSSLLLTPATIGSGTKKKNNLSVGANVLRKLKATDVSKIYTSISVQLTPKTQSCYQ